MTKRWKCTVCGQIFEGERPPVPCPVCGASEDAFVLLPDAGAAPFRRDSDETFIVVGAGAAGFEAAKAIRARNKTCRIQLYAGEGVIPYNRPALSDVLGDGYSFASIALAPYGYYAQSGIQLITDKRVSSFDPASRTVALSDGAAIGYDKLLLATGANPFNPVKSSPGAIPCFTLRSFQDAMAVGDACRGRRVLVVGGGILGLEAALALMELGAQITIVQLGARVLNLQADEQGSRRVHEAFVKLGATVLTETSVQELTPTGAVLTDGTPIECDAALVSAGVRSEISLATAAGLAAERGIVVDERMRTSAPDVFAAGDCAQHGGRVAGLWAAATEMGQVAGANMAGDILASYSPIVPATAFEVNELHLFSAGTLAGKQTMRHEDARSGLYRALYFEENRLVGAMFLGDVSESGQAIQLIAAGAPPREAKALLA